MKIFAIALASTLAMTILAQAQESNRTINQRKADSSSVLAKASAQAR